MLREPSGWTSPNRPEIILTLCVREDGGACLRVNAQPQIVRLILPWFTMKILANCLTCAELFLVPFLIVF